ncbi:MAG: tetratricopeptide repeat protein, partial [Candidatus Bathyarchaeota archaeon]|nr:tetratricopeptide repeat protein [Candidatus Bathyarchaeota archaeon]
KSYDRAVNVNPDYAEAWFGRGVYLSNRGRYEGAVKSYDEALKLKPGDAGAWYGRGVALSNLGRYDEALKSYNEALRLNLDYAEAWHNRGVALSNLRRYEGAVKSYNEAVRIKPGYAEAWHGRGVDLSNLGRHDEALKSDDKAVKLKPDYAEAWYGRGVDLSNLGRFDEALKSYDNALKLKPSYADALNAKNQVQNQLRAEKQRDERIRAQEAYENSVTAEEIRKFVNRRYFEPARIRGEPHVTITPGQIQKDMRIYSRLPLVCDALRSKAMGQYGIIRIKENRKAGALGDDPASQFSYFFKEAKSGSPRKKSTSEPPKGERKEPLGRPRNYYEVLGIRRDATREQIRGIYKRLSLIYHPDQGRHFDVDGEKPYREIKEAYETLIDPRKRAVYDRSLRR